MRSEKIGCYWTLVVNMRMMVGSLNIRELDKQCYSEARVLQVGHLEEGYLDRLLDNVGNLARQDYHQLIDNTTRVDD